jgi:hypothetical protein
VAHESTISLALEFVQGVQYGFSMGNVNWDLAGFTDELSRLGKKVGGGPILVPGRINLDLSTDELVWSLQGPHMPEIIESEPRILDDFVQLWRGKPKAILRFARSWGVLRPGNCCRRFAGLLHGSTQNEHLRPDFGANCLLDQREPLALWRYLSHRAVKPAPSGTEPNVRDERFGIAREVSGWMRNGMVR